MILLLSPAKSLDYDTPVPEAVRRLATLPRFIPQAEALIGLLRPLDVAGVARLMDLSDGLAQLNVGRFAAWSPTFDDDNSRPAVLAFNGDVYEGLQAGTLDEEALRWAQAHMVILSGLYGALRPLDRLQPYRLEMGTRLANPAGKDLYAWWGDTLAAYLDERLQDDPAPLVLNLASQEYAKAALRRSLKARVVECQFEEWHGGRWKIISFHAKRARGLMARHVVQHRVQRVEDLRDFQAEGYAHDPEVSTPQRLVFRRRQVA